MPVNSSMAGCSRRRAFGVAISVMKMAAAILNGRVRIRESRQTAREPVMNMAAPTLPPPSAVSPGFHSPEKRNSVSE